MPALSSSKNSEDLEIFTLDELINQGLITLGRGKIISRKDLAATPGNYPVYSSAKQNEGKFGEYGLFMFDEELITWSVDGGGRLFHRKKHKFSVTNVGGTLRINDTSRLDYKFLYYCLTLLHSKINFDWVKKAHPSIIRKLYNEIPVPPLEKQQLLVNILDKIFENIKQSAIQIQTKLDDVGDLFQSFFSAITEDSSTWDNKTVEELLLSEKGSIRTGPFGSQLLHSEFVDEGIAVLGIDNAVNNEFRWGKRRFITEEKYSQLSRYTVKPGDVIITIMGTCGRCAIIPDNIPTAINTKHLCCITLDINKCLPEYLHAYFLHHPLSLEYLNKMAKGSVMDGLNMGIIRKLPVLLPTISEQQNIIDNLNMVSNEIKKLENSYQSELENLTELKQSIMQEAFNGTLRIA